MVSERAIIAAGGAALPDDDRFYPRVFGLAVAALAALALYSILQPFVGPILWALLLAFLLHPLHVRLSRRLHGPRRRGVSAFLMTVLVTLAIILPASLIAPSDTGSRDRATSCGCRSWIAWSTGSPITRR
jgi:predicted PurR-regulated permease PerM